MNMPFCSLLRDGRQMLSRMLAAVRIDDAEGMHVGVLAEIFQLGLFVVGVYRYVDP